MKRISKPTPPEHIVLVDTNILWHEDKGCVVHPDFDKFWDTYVGSFPMKLIIPDVVRGELLFQITTSALKHLEKINAEFSNITRITGKPCSHRLTPERIRRSIQTKFDHWVASKDAEIRTVPVSSVEWEKVITDAIWRNPPFTLDAKNADNEKGFRDYMILETVCAVCKFYSDDVNIAFICNDFALRTAALKRLGQIPSFSVYEALVDFTSFIELTKKNLTERFVKNILERATKKFLNNQNDECLLYKDGFEVRIRDEFKSEIESPSNPSDLLTFAGIGSTWKHVGDEQPWIRRPQFLFLEGENVYHWQSTITYVRQYEREQGGYFRELVQATRRLMVLAINVHWKSTVLADGRFVSCEIVDYKRGDFSFDAPTEEQLRRYRLERAAEHPESQGAPTAKPPGLSG